MSKKHVFLAGVGLLSSVTMLGLTPTYAATSTSMTINVNGGSNFVTNFNPYSPTRRGGTNFVYEPLMIYNNLNGDLHPWLATQYSWSSNNKVLTFVIRHGTRWNDGTAFSAADVAFTFNLLKKNPALDANNVWSSLGSVEALGSDKVVFRFKNLDTTLFAFIAQTPIVSQHEWSKVKNPVTFNDPHPIGTGPYEVQKCIPSEYVLTANRYYWQKGKPAAQMITVPSLPSGAIADMKLSQGVFDWGGLFAPNMQKIYVDKDPVHNHYWYPKGPAVTLYTNDTVYPMSLVGFRKALAYAVNKEAIGNVGEYGYASPASQTGIILPDQQSWLSSSLKDPYQFNLSKAQQILSSLGFHKNTSGQLISPKGKPVQFTIEVPNGWIDWITDCQIIAQDFGKLGISVRTETPSSATWQGDQASGHFTLALNEATAGPNPWYYYDQTLASNETAPIGGNAVSNFERWTDKSTDAYLTEFRQTTNAAKQKEAIYGLEKIMVNDVPVIPLVYQAWWNQNSTLHFTGWPTAQNPYAVPAPYSYPDSLLVITSIQAVK